MTSTRDFWRRRPVMYRVFDADGRLIYVGQSINLPARVSEHRSQSWWWKPLAARLRIQVFPTVDAAKAAEKVAIQEEDPVFNSMGYGDWREKPYWAAADHELYYRWYRDVNFRDLEPEHAQRMLDAAFPERATRRPRAAS
jgi:excinuclease UvrABC nuclease subunit